MNLACSAGGADHAVTSWCLMGLSDTAGTGWEEGEPNERAPHPQALPEHLCRWKWWQADQSSQSVGAAHRADTCLLQRLVLLSVKRWWGLMVWPGFICALFCLFFQPVIPLDPSVSAEMKRSLSTAPSEEPKQRRSWRKDWRFVSFVTWKIINAHVEVSKLTWDHV